MASAKSGAVSPFAPVRFPDMPQIAGVRLASAAAGVRYAGRTDVMLAVLSAGSSVAGVFTRSATRSAAVLDCQEKIGSHSDATAAILVNSGNSNAFTGQHGRASVAALVDAIAEVQGVPAHRVFTSSTGVIGEVLPHDRIVAVLGALADGLSPSAWEDAARSIMTTDTYPKGASASCALDAGRAHVAGIAKGSGMIAPDMATMLAYVFTDAAVPQPLLQEMLSRVNGRTFNSISVDGDTSTSDTVLLAATGRGPAITDGSEDASRLEYALTEVMRNLAQQIVRDGEGASKFVEVAVSGARNEADARKVARAVCESPLVKTAFAGEDPNWGRIVMAVGKSGAEADRDRLSIRFGNVLVAENGWVAPNYREEDGAAYMTQSDLVVSIDLGLGDGGAVMWTCDLTARYVEINADYRS